jgi:hypothetical protein
MKISSSEAAEQNDWRTRRRTSHISREQPKSEQHCGIMSIKLGLSYLKEEGTKTDPGTKRIGQRIDGHRPFQLHWAENSLLLDFTESSHACKFEQFSNPPTKTPLALHCFPKLKATGLGESPLM